MNKLSYSDWMTQNPMGTMLDYNSYANSGSGLYDSFAGMDTSSMIPTAGYASNTPDSGMFDGATAAGFNDTVQGLSGLYGMYQGHQMLGLYEDQVNDAKTNSARMRADMDRRDATRKEWGSAFQQA